MKMLISLLLLLPLATACASDPSKAELDAEVKRLCAIDGGVKVYETVKLSAERFNNLGQVHLPSVEYAKADTDYYYVLTTTDIKGNSNSGQIGDPAIWRSKYQIVRKSDQKVMAEMISYTRRGGDIPGPWHPSHYTCPEGDPLRSVFTKH